MFFDYQSITEIRSAALTATIVAQSTAIANPVEIVNDDFSSNLYDWLDYNLESNTAQDNTQKFTPDGNYRWTLRSKQGNVWLIEDVPNLSVKNFTLSLKAKIIETPQIAIGHAALALLFRKNQKGDYYWIDFRDNNTYEVWLWQDRKPFPLQQSTHSDAFKFEPGSLITFKILVIDSTFAIYAENQKLAEIYDPGATLIEPGQVGLALHLDDPNETLTIDFDKLLIEAISLDQPRSEIVGAATARAIAPTETVVAQSTAIANRVIVFKDDFSSNGNNWIVGKWSNEATDKEYQIIDNKYRIRITSKKEGYRIPLLTPDLHPKDFSFKFKAKIVDTSDLAGTSDDFGISIKFRQEGNSYYYTRFGSKGGYRIELVQDDITRVITSTLNSVIRLDEGVSLGVQALGSNFILYVGDQELARVTDPTLGQAGAIDLAIELPAKQSVTVDFDDVEITEFVPDNLRDKTITTATARAVAPTKTVVAQSTAIANGVTVFEDDFETNKHDWSQGLEEDENGTVINEITSQGTYQSRIQSKKSKYAPHWIPNIPPLKDFQLKVETSLVESPNPISSAKIVLEFRSNKENGYWVEFNGNSSYQVYRKYQNEFELIQEDTTTDAFTLKEGITNTFEILEIGSTFTVFVNDKKLTTLPSIVANEFNTFSFGSQLAKANDILTINFDHLVIKEVSIDIEKPQLEASATARANATALAQIAPTITAVARATALADAVANTDLLFQDNFSSNTNNWFVGKNDDIYAITETQFVKDSYRRIMTSKRDVISSKWVPNFSTKNFWLQIKTTLVETSGQSGDANISIIFRKNAEGDYYRVAFANNATYKISRRDGAKNDWKIIQDSTYDEAINLAPGFTNTFVILAKDSSFTVYANGHELTSVKDITLSETGEVGLGIGLAKANQTLTVDFDNLIIKEAP